MNSKTNKANRDSEGKIGTKLLKKVLKEPDAIVFAIDSRSLE